MTTFSQKGRQALGEHIKRITESNKTPGFVLGVSNIDGEIYFEGSGKSVVGIPGSGDVNPDSVFWICSQTKLIVALAALKLIEQGRISYDTPVGDYLPDFRNPIIVKRTSTQKTPFRPAEAVVTVRHLMNFTSGLFYPVKPGDLFGLDESYYSKEIHSAPDPASEFLKIIKGELPALPLKFEPGTNFVYGWSSDVLGFVIEKVSGQTLEKFCKEHICDPLGMEASFYLHPYLRRRLVDLAFRDNDGNLSRWDDQLKIIERDENKVRLHMGGIGLYTSMRDYLTLLRHLLQINAGRAVKNPILKRDTVRTIFTPTLSEDASKSLSAYTMAKNTQWSTALALTTRDWHKRRRKGSAFWAGWAGTEYFMDPTTGIAVVYGTQILPTNDVESMSLFKKLEELIYEAVQLESAKL